MIFKETFRIPTRVHEWVRQAVAPCISSASVFSPSSSQAPWRSHGGRLLFEADYAYNSAGYYDLTLTGGDGSDVDKACFLMRHILRQIGDTFLIWTIQWTYGSTTFGVCATNLFEEKWSIEQGEENAKAKKLAHEQYILGLCVK